MLASSALEHCVLQEEALLDLTGQQQGQTAGASSTGTLWAHLDPTGEKGPVPHFLFKGRSELCPADCVSELGLWRGTV